MELGGDANWSHVGYHQPSLRGKVKHLNSCSPSEPSPASPASAPSSCARTTRSASSGPPGSTPMTGYRRYSPAQLPELRRILALRHLGMGLDEIGALVAGDDLRAALDRRRTELERERRLGRGAARRPGDQHRRCGLPRCRRAADGRRAGGRDAASTAASIDAFYELEAHVRDVGRRAHRPPGAIPEQREIFVPVTGPFPETERIAYRRLPAAGSHRSSIVGRTGRGRRPGRAASAGWRRRISSVAGPSGCSTSPSEPNRSCACHPGCVVHRDEDLVTELQLPVAEPRSPSQRARTTSRSDRVGGDELQQRGRLGLDRDLAGPARDR